jgi:hypothetical protein
MAAWARGRTYLKQDTCREERNTVACRSCPSATPEHRLQARDSHKVILEEKEGCLLPALGLRAHVGLVASTTLSPLLWSRRGGGRDKQSPSS